MKSMLVAGAWLASVFLSTFAQAQTEEPTAEAKPPTADTQPPVAPAKAAPTPASAPAAPATQAPQSGKIDLHVTEPAPVVERSHHVHDGFYLRINLGIGALSAQYSPEVGSDFESSGGTLALDLLAGGSPSKGLALGGALLTEAGVSHEVKTNNRSLGDVTVRAGLLGPFLDGFFDPKEGWHAGGALGLAVLRFDNPGGSDETTDMTGVGGAAWVGYDAWVGPEWSVGGLLRAGGSIVRSDESGVKTNASTFSLGLMFSGLYH